MSTAEIVIERLFEALINGDRPQARAIVAEQFDQGVDAETIVVDLLWPSYEQIERLYRADQITTLSYRLATRLLRVLVDQTSAGLAMDGTGVGAGRRVFAVSGPGEADEIGAQMAMDLLEHHGFGVAFAGGGVANDEIRAQVQEERPDVLLLFCSAPSDLPNIRALIDDLHEAGACPDLQIVVGGGVFNRAEGLAEEIGADLWASEPLELVDLMVRRAGKRSGVEQRTVGKKRRPLRKAA